MAATHYSAFYPSRRYWAGSAVDFSDQRRPNWFADQMAEEVFSRQTSLVALKVCRDGRIMLRIESLEHEIPVDSPKAFESKSSDGAAISTT